MPFSPIGSDGTENFQASKMARKLNIQTFLFLVVLGELIWSGSSNPFNTKEPNHVLVNWDKVKTKEVRVKCLKNTISWTLLKVSLPCTSYFIVPKLANFYRKNEFPKKITCCFSRCKEGWAGSTVPLQ